VLVASGVFTLVSYALRSRWTGRAPLVLAVLGAAPLISFGTTFALRGALWSPPVVAVLLGLAVIYDTVRAAAPRPEQMRRLTNLAWLMLVLAVAHGVLALVVPGGLRLPGPSWLINSKTILGVAMLIAAEALAVAWFWPRGRPAMQAVASLPFLVLAVAFAMTRRQPAALTYGVLALGLAFEPALLDMMHRRLNERAYQPRGVTLYEMTTEGAAWGFVLISAIAAAIEPAVDRRLGISVLALAVSLFTIFWFHFRSVQGARMVHTVMATAVYSFFGAGLVQLTGGLRSPYFFIYWLPVIALAWTRLPETILIPLTIPIATMVTETILMLKDGATPPGFGSLVIARIGGLFMIAGFSYALARRNLDDHTRARAARDQLETVLANMAEGLVAVDAQGVITICNPQARQLLGLDADPRGQVLTNVLNLRTNDGRVVEGSDHPVRRALAGDRADWEQLLKAGPTGSLPVAVAATPMSRPSGERGAIVLIRDVHAEVEMDRMRDDFFFIASHELRTPLTVMKGNLEMALEIVSEGPLKKTIAESLNSVGRLIRMVNDFLDAARLEHGSIKLRMDEAFLPDLVRQAVETMRPDAKRKGLEIHYQPVSGLAPVYMDSERTLQILLNLLGNAVRFTARGRIDVSHTMVGDVVETLVRDTGPGIPQEQYGRLFTRFGQVDRGLTRTGGGSGLGLYISLKLAEQMGGTVVLKHSVPGEGSTFALRLRAVRSAQLVGASPQGERTGSR
jgi:two-component system, OmpR family, phosphate regulon sensor histidine kinase PhoR